MYHCHLHIYLAGPSCPAFDRLKALPALPSFTHTFQEEARPTPDAAAKADVIFLDLEGLEPTEALETVTKAMGPEAQLIVLTGQDRPAALEKYYPSLYDIWVLPMSEGELDYRLGCWQERCKLRRDHWQTEQYLEATINATPNMIWYKTKDGIHEKVSDGFCAVVGKTREQSEGRDHCYIWDATLEEAEVCAQTDRKVMEGGTTVIAEERVMSNGKEILLTTYKSPLYDLDGSVMGTVGVAIDITKERAYQEDMLRKNHTLEAIFTSLDCGILLHSVDGSRVISINDAALNILGYDSLQELTDSGFNMVAQSVLDEDKPILRAAITSLKNVGDSCDVEYRARHKNGSIVHVLGNIKLIQENGQLCYQRFLLDVTSQKLQEQETYRRQLALIQALGIDYNIVGTFDLKTGLGIPLRLELPESIAQRLGYQLDKELPFSEFMARYIQELVYEPDRDTLYRFTSPEQLSQALDERRVAYQDFRVMLDGEIKFYELKAVRTGTWGSHQDVVLGIRSVDEATRSEMKQRQLLEDALAQANRANKAKSTFLSNMSHDIRTPMNAIVGFTALAQNHIQEITKVAEYLTKIHASSDHLLRLLNDVLDMSAIESGKMQLSEAPCSLPDILSELKDLVQVDTQNKQLRFTIDHAAVVDTEVYCDKLRLDQVLLNIISNAIRYTPSGGSVTLTVTQSPAPEMGYQVYTFRLQDTGIGMSPEFLERIFEPFERERNSTTSGIQGTGLGMAITKNIVDMMNGAVRVTSVQGEGTTVTISVPFRLSQEAAADSESVHTVSDPSHRGDGKILLVEDNDLNREIAEVILQDAGFTAETAENGKVALDMLTSHEPGYYKLILMDIQMPVMNGYEATQAIRRLEDKKLATIPIIAMTANAFEEDKRQALRCGMNDHIAKPIDMNKLLQTLDKFMSW